MGSTSRATSRTSRRRTAAEAQAGADGLADVPPLDGPTSADLAVESAAHDGPRGYSSGKTAHLKRMARIEGQVRGIARMIDEDEYCIDVLTQVSAVTKALQAVGLSLLEEHMAHCVARAVAAGPDEGAAKLKEAHDAIARLVRS